MSTAHSGDTGMRLYQGEDWPVPGDEPETMLRGHHWATLRRIGWLDQKGRVWPEIPPTDVALNLGSGSFTPLLIDTREDNGR